MAECDTLTLCSKCGIETPAEQLAGRRCRACMAANARSWYRRKVESDPDYSRRRNYQRHYGLSLDEADAILARGCALLGMGECGGRRLCIDHDHESGDVRGCLCDYHNVWLSRLEASSDSIERVIDYLGVAV